MLIEIQNRQKSVPLLIWFVNMPIWFFWDTYYDFALASGMEQSYIDSYVRYYTSPGWLAFILLFTTLMGFLGCMVGSRLIRRHFQKAGVL